MKIMKFALATGATSTLFVALFEQLLSLSLTDSPMACSSKKTCPARGEFSHCTNCFVLMRYCTHQCIYVIVFIQTERELLNSLF